MKNTLKRYCMEELGWTLKEFSVYMGVTIAIGTFCALWVCGMLPFHN